MPTAAETMAERRWLTGGRAYPQIAGRIRDQIHTGQFPPGTVLPSEAELCRTFGVARNTVRRGLAILEDEGLVVTVPSKGRVVAGEAGEPPRTATRRSPRPCASRSSAATSLLARRCRARPSYAAASQRRATPCGRPWPSWSTRG